MQTTLNFIPLSIDDIDCTIEFDTGVIITPDYNPAPVITIQPEYVKDAFSNIKSISFNGKPYCLIENEITKERKWVVKSRVWTLSQTSKEDREQRRIEFWDADGRFSPE